jgi:hypothetical protein
VPLPPSERPNSEILAALRAEFERLLTLQLVHSENTEAKHAALSPGRRREIADLVRSHWEEGG